MASSKGSGTKMVVWGIMGLLIVGLGGFGATNFGGSVQKVASVGDEPVSTDDYARALQNRMSQIQSQLGQSFTIAEAQQFGVPQQVLDDLLDNAALDAETDDLGLSVGDEAVRRNLLNTPAFQGLTGTFDNDTYRATLQRANLNARDYEDQIRSDEARAILQGALATGVTMPASYGQAVVDWLGERRTIATATLSAGDLTTGVPVPTDEDLEKQYQATPDAYTAPEAREVTFAWITPAMLSDDVELDEDTLRALYDENIDQFVQPERRLVERLVFGSTEDAQAAADRIEAGESSFEDEVAARGLELADVDLGDVTQDRLGTAGETVFAQDGLGVVGPVDTDLGPALFRVNGVLEASETPFEDARDELGREMALDAASREIGDRITDLDDLLAAGATIEELADETILELGTIAWTPESEEGIAAYDAFVEAVQAVQEGDFPEIVELSDGGVFAMRLDGTRSAALRPFAEVRDQVEQDWIAAETARQLQARAEELETSVATGTSLSDLGLPTETFEAVTRQDFLPSMPGNFMDTAFAPGLTKGGTTIVADDDRVIILQVDEILPPETNEDNSAIAQNYIDSAAQGAAQDVVDAFVSAVRAREGISINQTAINAVHAQLP